MKIIKETLNMDSNGLLIYYDIYRDLSINKYNGVIQIAHGMIEHKGNYAYIAHTLSKAGYIVAINDHRGHGESIGNDIFLGEMGENGFELAMQDMHNLTIHLKNQYKPKKFILIGHSMGSLLSRRYLQEYENEIDILILCGSPSPYFGITPGILFLKLCKILGFNKIGKNIAYKLSFLSFNAKYKKNDNLNNGKVSGKLWTNRDIDEILMALPSIKNNDRREIIKICNSTGVKLKTLPGIYELINGKISINQIRDVEIEDLLGRDPVELNMEGIEEYIKDKVILITGGGGSIGSELCRQIVKFNPKKLVILDIYENGAYDLQMELNFKYPNIDKDVVIASIREKKRLEEVFEKYNPDVVFHAAAHKHVPLMEANPKEAIKNNVVGTLNLAKTADKYKVKKFVLISTDKAVNPTNIMGATKRMCEMIIQSINKESKTEFVAVRFGNVLGSNGSVIPLFKKQIKEGGPITVTHPEINRYFMTIPEAAQLVIQAGSMAKGGEIFILDMGSPVKILDLANDLIRLSGLEPEKDIKIQFTGLRPGEKLYEELLMDEEGMTNTNHKKIFIGKPGKYDFKDICEKVDKLKSCLDKDDEEIFNKVQEIVPTYNRKK